MAFPAICSWQGKMSPRPDEKVQLHILDEDQADCWAAAFLRYPPPDIPAHLPTKSGMPEPRSIDHGAPA
jgi:hypothetical protein